MPILTIYTTGRNCGRCNITKHLLDREGVAYREVNIHDDPAARAYITETLGYSEAPVCVFTTDATIEHWSGFQPDRIHRIATTLNN